MLPSYPRLISSAWSRLTSSNRSTSKRCRLRKRSQSALQLETLEERVLLSGTDLSIALSSDVVAVQQGGEISYEIMVMNNGPTAVTDAHVIDEVAGFLDSASWTATFNGGATGNGSGAGDINEMVELPVGGSVTYVLSGTVQEDVQDDISNVASVESATVDETSPEDNVAGDADIVVLNATSGSALFEKSDEQDADTSVSYWSVELGDIDGDGDLDAVAAGGLGDDLVGESNLRLWINDGTGAFTEDLQLQPPGHIVDAQLADFDGDGALDIFAIGADGVSVHYLWTNNGSGSFTQASQTTYDWYAEFTTVGDVNNDGHVDVLADDDFGNIRTLVNDGAGNFSESSTVNAHSYGYVMDLELGDFDDDGDLDLVSISRSYDTHGDSQERVFINDGVGNFTLSQNYFRFGDIPNALDVGDIDGDGDLDIVIGLRNYSGDNVKLLLNDGSGDFAYGTIIQPQDRVRDLTLADLDADGDQDIIFSKYSSSSIPDDENLGNEIYINDGSGTFSRAPRPAGLSGGYHAVGDLNNDGSLDFFVLNGRASKDIYFNTNTFLLPYVHDFEGNGGGLLGVQVNSPGTTEVVEKLGDKKLEFDNSGLTGLSTALLQPFDPVPENFSLAAEITPVGGPDRWQDGFLIFDYQSETDFKYAGMFAGQNQWVIGHYQGNWSNRLSQVDWDDTGRDIKANKPSMVQVDVVGGQVTLFVNGEQITSANFGGPLNGGDVGVAAENAVTCFDDIQLLAKGNEIVEYDERFYTTSDPLLIPSDPARVKVVSSGGDEYLRISTNGYAQIGTAIHETEKPLTAAYRLETSLRGISGPDRWGDGFLIFDYKNENDFKYAGAFIGQNQWVIGHYQGDWGDRLLNVDWDDESKTIDHGTFYDVEVEVTGRIVRLSVDGNFIGAANFDGLLNEGAVGMGNYYAQTDFNDFKLYTNSDAGLNQVFPYYHNFDDETFGEFIVPPQNLWEIQDFNGSPALYHPGDISYVDPDQKRLLLDQPEDLPHNFDFSLDFTPFPAEGFSDSGGFFVFDYENEDNYKYFNYQISAVSGWWSMSEVHDGDHDAVASYFPDSYDEKYSVGDHLTVQLEIRGGLARVVVDQRVIMEFNDFDDPNLNNGQLGFGAAEGPVFIDDVRLDVELERLGDWDPNIYYFGGPDEDDLFEFYPSGNRFNSVENTQGPGSEVLRVTGLTNQYPTAALVPARPNMPESFELSVEMASEFKSGGWHDGFLVFDWVDRDDFKYAGMFTGQNEWIIGHYQGGYENRLIEVDWDDTGRSINQDQVYLVHLDIDDNHVEMRVDGEIIGSATFGESIYDGQVGLAVQNANTSFDNFFFSKDVAHGDVGELPFELNNNVQYDNGLINLNEETVGYREQSRDYTVDATAENNVGGAILPMDGPMPTDFSVAVDFNSDASPQPFRTGFIIFDYQNENDFKFAGALVSQNRWVIGHYQGHFGNRLADVNWADESRSIDTETWYSLEVIVNGADVELLVDGESIADVTFADPVNGGPAGVAVKGSNTTFRNIAIEELTPSAAAIDLFFSENETDDDEILI